jgi:hypothetical protein
VPASRHTNVTDLHCSKRFQRVRCSSLLTRARLLGFWMPAQPSAEAGVIGEAERPEQMSAAGVDRGDLSAREVLVGDSDVRTLTGAGVEADHLTDVARRHRQHPSPKDVVRGVDARKHQVPAVVAFRLQVDQIGAALLAQMSHRKSEKRQNVEVARTPIDPADSVVPRRTEDRDLDILRTIGLKVAGDARGLLREVQRWL